MPYLEKAKKRPRSVKTWSNEARSQRVRVYCTERWKRLRIGYLMAHPTCELCEARGIVTLAEDVHHASSFQLYDGALRLAKAFDSSNLIALCKHCHAYIHRFGATRETDLEAEARAADEDFGNGVIPHKYV